MSELHVPPPEMTDPHDKRPDVDDKDKRKIPNENRPAAVEAAAVQLAMQGARELGCGLGTITIEVGHEVVTRVVGKSPVATPSWGE